MTITLLDGGMGQELLARSKAKPTALWATQFLMDTPELVSDIHADFFKAGADIATTNSYAIHRDRLQPLGIEHRFSELQRRACQLAVAARDKFGYGLVAGAIGPTGWSYRPDMAPPAEEAAEVFAEIARLQAPFVDLIVCETMASVEQARGAVMGVNVVDKPVWLAVTVDDGDGTRLRSGEPVTDILSLMDTFKLDALLVNCSTPEAVNQAVPLLVNQGVPIGAYANGFTGIVKDFTVKGATVDMLEKRLNLSPEVLADFADGWIEQGAVVVGGCCEVGPAHIKEMAGRLKKRG